MRVIIRRPHAYFFLNETFADEGGIASANPAGCVTEHGTELPLPGLYVLDSEGRFVAAGYPGTRPTNTPIPFSWASPAGSAFSYS